MNQPPKKRRFSFSLRTLMVFMLVVGVLLGLVGRRVHRARYQQAFLEELYDLNWYYISEDTPFSPYYNDPAYWDLFMDSDFIDRIETVRYVDDMFAIGNSEEGLDIAPLLELRNLKSIHIGSQVISDLMPLVELKNLQELTISNTPVTDLSPLKELENLRDLSISDTPVTDFTPLVELKNLQNLDLSNSQVRDLTPLAKLQNLKSLKLEVTHVVDLMPLAELKNLESLFLYNIPDSYQQYLQLQKELPNCQIQRW